MAAIIYKENIMFELSQKMYCPGARTHLLTAASPESRMTAFVFGRVTCKFPTSYWIDLQQVKFSAGSKTLQHLMIRYLQ